MRRAFALVGVVVLVLAVAPSAGATSGTMVITSDTTLTEDHDGVIVVEADGVTLDCANFTVTAWPWLWYGILVYGYDDVIIRNCQVTNALNGIAVVGYAERTTVAGNSTFANVNAGIAADQAIGTQIVGNTATENGGNGIQVIEATGVLVADNTSSQNRDAGIATARADSGTFRDNVLTGNALGLGLGASDANLVSDNMATGNGTGFGADDGSTGNVFVGNEATHNPDSGFRVTANENTLRSNLATGNGTGFVLENASGNSLQSNVAKGNVTGLAMHWASGNVLTGNRYIDSGPEGWGVWVADSSNDNRFKHNIARRNDYEGFAIVGSSGNELLRNISQASNYQGISLYFGAEYNVVRANVLTGNAGSGVLVVESSNNSITDNRSMRNNEKMIENEGGISIIEGSSSNQILRNVACNNGNADGYDDGSGTGNVWEANRFCTSSGIPAEGVEVYFDDLDGFDLAAESPSIMVSFDDLTTPLDITGQTLAGIGFGPGDAPSPSAPLEVVAGAGTFTVESDFGGVIDATANRLFPTSESNVLSPGGDWLAPGPDPLAENDDLNLRFQGQVHAVGFDILFQSLDCCSYVALSVFGPDGHILYSNRMIPTGSEGEGGDAGGAVFVGFVSKTTRITRILVDEFDGDSEYPDSNIGFDTFRVASG